jgi:hypothetical protein
MDSRKSPLKVYRTTTGFHDAYVAAPSQKAALEAWGTDKNLFARGVAERVTDPKLTAEPLATPGKVIKVSRGDLRELLAADPKPRRAASKNTSPTHAKPWRPKPKPRPRPSRAEVAAVEAELAAFEAEADREIAELRRREERLRKERDAAERKLATERAKLEARLNRAEERYRQALDRWRASD